MIGLALTKEESRFHPFNLARALESSNVARKAAGIFSFFGTFQTWLGLIPAAAVIPGMAPGGVAADLGVRVTGADGKTLHWYTVGAQMHSVAKRQMSLQKQ